MREIICLIKSLWLGGMFFVCNQLLIDSQKISFIGSICVI